MDDNGGIQASLRPAVADVSVIIPVYKAEDTIGRSLASVVAQTLPPAEVVVVDDGSPDASAAIAETWRERLAPTVLTILRQDNAGAGAARNRALAAATATFVAFLDADDEWMPEKLADCVTAMTGRGLDMVSTDMTVREGDGREVYFDCARHWRAFGGDPFVSLFLRGWVATSTVVVRRALVAEGFETSLRAAQDYDLWLSVLGRPTTRLEVIPRALTLYHRTAGSISTQVERRRQCSLRVAWRHYPKLKQRRHDARRLLLLRLLIIHYEALNAYIGCRQWLNGMVIVAKCAFELSRACLMGARRPT